ncbi:MAG: DUF1611 domain-containing protein [Alkalinema sp. RU_4_3]|nr:DUF1611 domain-containing protein [Alkalinema sp. RU_4_3]
MFQPHDKIAVLLHGGIKGDKGKTGLALVRFRPESIAVVIDAEAAGESFAQLTGIDLAVPIVASVQEALSHHPDWLAIGIAPSGGVLPEPWRLEVKQAVAAGLSIANGLHTKLMDQPDLRNLLQPGQQLWDMRQENPGLKVGSGAAANLPQQRILTVGTDMSVGKMSTSLALHHACIVRGLRSQFLGTGQAGIMIAGSGIALDAIRVDFASGAVEKLVMESHEGADILHIEGQGSLLNPASTATLPLIRGSQPTDLVLVHRAGQTAIRNFPQVPIPPLPKVIALYEAIAAGGGAFAGAKVGAIALNTAHMTSDEAYTAIQTTQEQTGLPCDDVIRNGGKAIIAALLKE